ncbi:hypothetical protein DFJ73DRAFT_816199 [Zopfochytrium polystomum]|nr:hypothetical protein DFJ73DRAFT_816199 [Zopfochytrium polystomum]
MTSFQDLPPEVLTQVLENLISAAELFNASQSCRALRRASSKVAQKYLERLSAIIRSVENAPHLEADPTFVAVATMAMSAGSAMLIHFDVPEASIKKFFASLCLVDSRIRTDSWSFAGAIWEAKIQCGRKCCDAVVDTAEVPVLELWKQTVTSYLKCNMCIYSFMKTPTWVPIYLSDLTSTIPPAEISTALELFQDVFSLHFGESEDRITFYCRSSDGTPPFGIGAAYYVKNAAWLCLEALLPHLRPQEAVKAWILALSLILFGSGRCGHEKSHYSTFQALCSRVSSSLTSTIIRAAFDAVRSKGRSITEDDLSFLTRIDGTPANFQEVKKSRWAELLIACSPLISLRMWDVNAKAIIQNVSRWKLEPTGELDVVLYALREGLLPVRTTETFVHAAIEVLRTVPDPVNFTKRQGILTSGFSILAAASDFCIKMKDASLEHNTLTLQVALRNALAASLDCKYLRHSSDENVSETLRLLTSLVPTSEVFREWELRMTKECAAPGLWPWRNLHPAKVEPFFTHTVRTLCKAESVLGANQVFWLQCALQNSLASSEHVAEIYLKCISMMDNDLPGNREMTGLISTLSKKCNPAETRLLFRLACFCSASKFESVDETVPEFFIELLFELGLRLPPDEQSTALKPIAEYCRNVVASGEYLDLTLDAWNFVLEQSPREDARMILDQVGRLIRTNSLYDWEDVSLHHDFPLAKLPKSDIDAIWKLLGDSEEKPTGGVKSLRYHLDKLPPSDPSVMAEALASSFDSMLGGFVGWWEEPFAILPSITDVDSLLFVWRHFFIHIVAKHDTDFPSLIRHRGIFSLRAIEAWKIIAKIAPEWNTDADEDL